MEFDYVEQGDCLELMKQIPDGSIDMILCDLPYGVTACKWDVRIEFEHLWEQYERIIKNNGAIVLTASQPFASMLVMSNPKLFRYEIIWDKVNISNPMLAKKRFLSSHENILIFYKKQPTYNPQMVAGTAWKRGGSGAKNSEVKFMDRNIKRECASDKTNIKYPKSIITHSNANRTNVVHPTQKPVALLEYLIKTYTNPGEIVLDNCMGSGSTCVAAVNAGRHYIGFELDEKYFQIACQRLDEAEKAVSV